LRPRAGRSQSTSSRRQRALRLDVALGVLAAIVAILIAPGIALVGIVAVVVLIGAALSFLYNRRARRAQRPVRRRGPSR
jgi:Flp pilus assembly protein TadB